jgi:hypothetical protein
MPEVGNFMTLDAGDIHSIMGVETGDIETVMGLEYPAGTIPWAGVTGLQFGGNHYYHEPPVSNEDYVDEIQYKTIGTSSNAQDFGDITSGGRDNSGGVVTGLSSARAALNCCSKYGSRYNDETDYITVATTANTQDFGNKTRNTDTGAHMSNGTLAFISSGQETGSSYTSYMAYKNISSTGDYGDAGDAKARREVMSVSGDTRGATGGGSLSLSGAGYAIYKDLEYITFSTSANAQAFGDMTKAGWGSMGIASQTRWIMNNGYYYKDGEGSTYSLFQDYFTAASGSAAQDFGDDTLAYEMNGSSNGTRGEIWGGYVDAAYIAGTNYNLSGREGVRYVTIASTGDSQETGGLMVHNYEGWGGTAGRIVGALLGNAGGSGT